MYGFGDDRNPANDTVSVMEEILIEYITDIVRLTDYPLGMAIDLPVTVSTSRWPIEKDKTFDRRPSTRSCQSCRCKEACPSGGATVHARGYQACSSPVRRGRESQRQNSLNRPQL